MKCENKPDMEGKSHQILEKYLLVGKLHRLYLERELSCSGVFRSQHQLLMHISKFPNASQKDIANHHHVSTATVAVSLKKLEKGGYISRMMDAEDNRFNQICITPKGKAIVDEGIKVFQKTEQALFKSFTDEELLVIENLFDRMRYNLDCLFQESGHDSN